MRGVAAGVLFLALLLSPPTAAQPSPFTEEAAARGLHYELTAFPQGPGFHGNGIGLVDLDGDGDPDIVVLGKLNGTVGIYENIGGGVFVNRSATTGIPLLTEMSGFAAADYDADGRIDLYVTQFFARNVLLKNLGGFTFIDVGGAAGVDDTGYSTGPSWGDYNGDGWLDIYVSNYNFFDPIGSPNRLYRNNGNGTFTDVAPDFGLDSEALSFQSVWSDYDKDGDPDLYISNDRAPEGFPPNALWRNDDGVMVDVSIPSAANVELYSMGLASGDFDGDAYPDYYVTNIFTDNGGGLNPLLLNQGDGMFAESADAAGVSNYITSWSAIFFDYDNNTYKDLYVNNMFLPNSFFVNSGDFPCVEMAATLEIESDYCHAPGETGCDISYCSAVGDVDGDGDLDLLVNNIGDRSELYINHEGSKRNYVRYRVVGEYPNLFAVGVSIETTAGGRTFWDQNYAGGNGYLGQNELVLHVGLGQTTIVDQSVVQWPSAGPSRTLTHLPVNQTWTIYPPSLLCDADGGGALNNDDFVAFSECFVEGFGPGCEMMDFDGDSSIYTDDLEKCFVAAPSDCNGNGTEDLAEIMLDLGLDGDGDGAIDCCGGGATPHPNPVGSTLRLDKSGGNVLLNWDIPPADAANDPATSYDVFVSRTTAGGEYGLLTGATATTALDPDTMSDRNFYVVGARNSCGSSGEEPF